MSSKRDLRNCGFEIKPKGYVSTRTVCSKKDLNVWVEFELRVRNGTLGVKSEFEL